MGRAPPHDAPARVDQRADRAATVAQVEVHGVAANMVQNRGSQWCPVPGPPSVCCNDRTIANPMKTLQLQLRFLIPLLVALVAAALVVLPLMDQLTLRWSSRDLNTRGTLVAGALADSIDEAVAGGSTARLQGVFDRAARNERLVAVGLCSKKDQLVRHSSAYPQTLTCEAARDAAHRPD